MATQNVAASDSADAEIVKGPALTTTASIESGDTVVQTVSASGDVTQTSGQDAASIRKAKAAQARAQAAQAAQTAQTAPEAPPAAENPFDRIKADIASVDASVRARVAGVETELNTLVAAGRVEPEHALAEARSASTRLHQLLHNAAQPVELAGSELKTLAAGLIAALRHLI